MELACELHMTVGQLRRAMSERELSKWYRLASTRFLPSRRLELGIAQVGLSIAQAMGGNTELTLADFLFGTKPDKPKLKAEDGAMAIDAIAGGIGVRMLGQGRKKKGGA